MTVVRLDATQPFHHEAALALLAAHAIPGTESTDLNDRTHTRLIPTANVQIRVTVAFDPAGVTADIDADPRLQSQRRRGDPCMAGPRRRHGGDGRNASSRFRVLRAPVERRPGVRPIGYPDEFEAVAATVLGQRVSLAAARTFAGRLTKAFGVPVQEVTDFPTPEAIAVAGPAELQRIIGLTRARTATRRAVAVAQADGLTVRDRPLSEARAALLAIPGIGPWTADYVSVRALQHPDTFAPGDLVARRALSAAPPAEAAVRADAWAPSRSYGMRHLWTDSAYVRAN